MNSYVVTYDDSVGLFDDYKVIQGKTPKEALKQAYNREFNRLTGDAGRYANVILLKGTYDKESNTIRYDGRGQRLCFGYVQ